MKYIVKLALVPAAVAAAMATGSIAGGLPGGATSLVETHGSWQLNCSDEAATVNCIISQAQINSETEQQMLAIELRPDGAGGLSGALVLPFGLALSQGITVGIDDQEANAALGFTTCLPVGCIVPIGFDASSIDALGDANQLSITATISDSGDPISLAVIIPGMKSAVDRMQDILANDG